MIFSIADVLINVERCNSCWCITCLCSWVFMGVGVTPVLSVIVVVCVHGCMCSWLSHVPVQGTRTRLQDRQEEFDRMQVQHAGGGLDDIPGVWQQLLSPSTSIVSKAFEHFFTTIAHQASSLCKVHIHGTPCGCLPTS